MKANVLTLLLLLIISSSSSSRGYTMQDLCYIWSGPGYIGDPTNCSNWGYCQDNHLVTHGSCPANQLYNFRDGTCRSASQVNCQATQEEICVNLEPDNYVADKSNCSKYRKCGDDWHDERKHFQCPKGELFSDRLQKCVKVTNDSKCPQAKDICSKIQNGSRLRDTMDCRNYRLCVNGIAQQQRCSAGRYFNPHTAVCQSMPPEHLDCDLDSDYISHPPPETDVYVCLKYYRKDLSPGPTKLFSDALTCHGYYVCNSQFDVGVWQSCPLGLHFQWWSQKCAPANTYSCPYDRCGNLIISMVSIINTGCRKYALCYNDKSTHMEQCPMEYPYFDEAKGFCSKKFPNLRVCYMNG